MLAVVLPLLLISLSSCCSNNAAAAVVAAAALLLLLLLASLAIASLSNSSDDILLRFATGILHKGHEFRFCIHIFKQSAWNTCIHPISPTRSPSSNSVKHIVQCGSSTLLGDDVLLQCENCAIELSPVFVQPS